MLFGLMKSERERAAEHDAALLRAHYGDDAKAFCECALSGQERPQARRAIQLILRALDEPAASRPARFDEAKMSAQALSVSSQAV